MTAAPTPSTKKDLTGKTFGGWTVLEETPKTRKGSSTWKCRCECGAVRFNVFYTALTTGRSTSCGCRRKGAKRNRARSPSAHSQGSNITYQTWMHIKTRCFNLNHPSSRGYGQRGVGMAREWRTSFPAFLADMGERPSHEHRLERINPQGHYTPDNCRWVQR